MLKILIVSTSSSSGGAAIAAHRLMAALNRSGKVEAKMLVRDCESPAEDVLTIGNPLCNKLKFAFERGVIWLCNRFSRKNLFQVSIANTGYDITKTAAFKAADIIHIHWTQQGMLSLRDMRRIFNSGKPVVWTMHDMWACTGICHHSEDCEKFRTGCHDCQYLRIPSRQDLSFRGFSRKLSVFRNASFSVITCSDWLRSKAEASALLKGKRIVTIPNPIDTELYCPKPKLEARETLGLPLDRKLVLFASQKVTDPRKGIDYLLEAAGILKARGAEVEFVIMGGRSGEMAALLPCACHSLGYVSSPERAALVYSACDVFVTPSLMENLPNTIMEAMSCGTPCVGFNVGGIPEMIDHKENGYVAEYKSAADLAEGMRFTLFNPDSSGLCTAAREKVLCKWSEDAVAERYFHLIREISIF